METGNVSFREDTGGNKYESILAETSGIDNTGQLTSVLQLGSDGYQDFNILILGLASGSTDDLLVSILGSVDGTNYAIPYVASHDGTAALATLRTYNVGNIITVAGYIILEVRKFAMPTMKVKFASEGATDTWTVTAWIQRYRTGSRRG